MSFAARKTMRGLASRLSPTTLRLAVSTIAVIGLAGCGGSSVDDLAWTDETPAWSPDGKKIVFASNRAHPKSGIDHLYVMNADGTGVRRLTRDRLDAREPSFSPDGKRIVYAVNVLDGSNHFTEASAVETISADGTRARRLTDMGGDVENPAWSPDGRWIAYLKQERRYRTDLYIVRPDGSGRRRVAIDVEPWAFSWSPDSEEIAVGGGDRGIVRIDANARRPIRVGRYRFITDIAWSPKPSTVAFVRGEPTFDGSGNIAPRHLALLDMQARTTRRLREVVDWKSVGSFETTITWLRRRTPTLAIFDGARIRFVEASGRKLGSVKTVNWGELSVGSASPDGKKLLIVDGPDDSYASAIFVTHTDGQGFRRLTQR